MVGEADKSCPQCKGVAIGKASVLYYDCIAADRSQEWLPPNWESLSRYQMVPTEAKAREELAGKLAPPPIPSDYGGLGGGAEIAWAVGELGGCEETIFALIVTPILIIFVLLIKGLFALGRKLLGKQAVESIEAVKDEAPMPPGLSPWQMAMSRWDSLYYCAHCDGVFIPGHDKLVPSKKMREFVYR